MVAATSKRDIKRSKAYTAFTTSSGYSLEELCCPQATTESYDAFAGEQGGEPMSTEWLWLINAWYFTDPRVQHGLSSVEGLVDVVEWLNKPYILLQFSSSHLCRLAYQHFASLSASADSPKSTPLFAELARPFIVPTLLSCLEPSNFLPLPLEDSKDEQGRRRRIWDNGLIVIEDWVTEVEEADIMDGIRGEEGWSSDLSKRQSRHAGPVFQYETFAASETEQNPMPTYLEKYLERLPRLPGEQVPDQLTIQYYPPGTGIPPHVDTHSVFQESLYSLSLNSAVDMVLVECGAEQARRLRLPKRSLQLSSSSSSAERATSSLPAAPLPPSSTQATPRTTPQQTYTIRLPPRSLLILTGASRFGFTHGIPPRRNDQVGKRLVPRDAGGRYSVTFRKVLRGVECRCDWGMWCDSRIREEERAQATLLGEGAEKP